MKGIFRLVSLVLLAIGFRDLVAGGIGNHGRGEARLDWGNEDGSSESPVVGRTLN
jgi:hypothetical protein